MSSPNKDRAIFSRVKFLPSIDLAVKKSMEAKKSKIKWKPQTKTDLEQEGHPLLSSLSLREYCAGHCHCNCQSDCHCDCYRDSDSESQPASSTDGVAVNTLPDPHRRLHLLQHKPYLVFFGKLEYFEQGISKIPKITKPLNIQKNVKGQLENFQTSINFCCGRQLLPQNRWDIQTLSSR